MDFINITPFPPFYFSNIDQLDREFHILIFKGTFALRNGEPILPLQDQLPIGTSDTFHKDDVGASVLMESDIVPFKPQSDLNIIGSAHAPFGKPLSTWQAKVSFGKVKKTIRVHGPREWKKQGIGWQLEESQPTLSVPLLYERAFGGTWENEKGEIDCFERNPIGCGYIPKSFRSDIDSIPAPQFEYPDHPVSGIDELYDPAGFGPVGRGWLPRRELVGTTDDEWLREDCPGLPWDFDFDFYNCAPRDLWYPGFLRGDESFELSGLHREGVIKSSLPGLAIGARINRQMVTRAFLDTVTIDTDNDVVTLLWRATFRLDEHIEHIEARYVEVDKVMAA